jgi:hypothetical protein
MLFKSEDNYTITGYEFKRIEFEPNTFYDNATSTLKINCSNGKTLSLCAAGDCCSDGWIEFNNLENHYNKTIVQIEENGDIDLPDSGVQEYDQNVKVTIYFSDETQFDFVHPP